jgi:hypothetical protein
VSHAHGHIGSQKNSTSYGRGFVMPNLGTPSTWRAQPERTRYLMASGLIGDPTAPVIGKGGATNRNS